MDGLFTPDVESENYRQKKNLLNFRFNISR